MHPVKRAWRVLKTDGPILFVIELLVFLSLYGPPKNVIRYWLGKLIGIDKVVVMIQGSWMLLSLKDGGINSDLLLNGIRENQFTKYLQTIMRPNWVVVDVGANIGYYALMEARQVAQIFALEPDPDNYDHLRTNIALNNYKNITTIQTAAGNANGVIKFDCSKIPNRRIVSESGDIQVSIKTLDDLLSDVKVDLVRMDVEGYEMNILMGARNILEKGTRLFMEMHKDLLKNYGSSALELLELLASYNYRVEKSLVLAKDGPTGNLKDLLKDGDTRKTLTEKGLVSYLFLTKETK